MFTERGFSEASIADIVQRAGSSVGSLYHHFGGKSELFLTLWQEHQLAHEEAAGQAVAEARKQGVTDPSPPPFSTERVWPHLAPPPRVPIPGRIPAALYQY